MPEANQALSLLVGGQAFAGWQSVRVRRSIEQCAGGFELAVSELWHNQRTPMSIKPGARCEVMIGQQVVITGHVDGVDLSMGPRDHGVTVSGRDATADLVDCSATGKPGQWRGRRIEQIAAELAAPFGVPVRADVDTGKPLASFALQEGESVFEAIDRAARMRALLLVSDGLGGLLITRAGTRRAPTRLVLGQNMLGMRVRADWRDRFSHYVAKGQAPGNDFFSGVKAAQVLARAQDPGVTRFRPFVLTNDAPDLAATLQQRVQWEANVRAARSLVVEVAVQGWRHELGLWEPNTLVAVSAPDLRVDAELLIASVQYTLDDRGSVAELAMVRSDAFNELPKKSDSAAGGTGAFWQGVPGKVK